MKSGGSRPTRSILPTLEPPRARDACPRCAVPVSDHTAPRADRPVRPAPHLDPPAHACHRALSDLSPALPAGPQPPRPGRGGPPLHAVRGAGGRASAKVLLSSSHLPPPNASSTVPRHFPPLPAAHPAPPRA